MLNTSNSVFISFAQARPDDLLDATILAELQELRRLLPDISLPSVAVESLDLMEACAQEKARRRRQASRHQGG
jgi:hypothetical protein